LGSSLNNTVPRNYTQGGCDALDMYVIWILKDYTLYDTFCLYTSKAINYRATTKGMGECGQNWLQ